MRHWIWPVTTLLTICCFFQAQADQGKSDKDLLQGSWEVVGLTMGGKEPKEKKEKNLVLTFKGDKLHTSEGGKDTKEEDYKLDETKNPKQIDIRPRGQGQGLTGIYELKDDTVRIGYGIGETRPKDFSDAVIVMSLKKKKS